MPRVKVYKADPENSYRVVKSIFEDFPLEVEKKKVFIKPNMLGPHPISHHTTTHPYLIRALVRYLKDRGAYVIVGDNPGVGGYGSNEKSAYATGIYKASLGCYQNIGLQSTEVPIVFDTDSIIKVPVSKIVFEADIFISVPRFKTHSLSQITGSIKNSFGIIPGAMKARLHKLFPSWMDFSRMLVEIYKVRYPDLIIMDAFTAMEGNGPSGAPLRRINRILASYNGVALDIVMAQMMGVDPLIIEQIAYAIKNSVQISSINDIRVAGDFFEIKDFKMPTTSALTLFSPLINRLGFPLVQSEPMVIEENCTQCWNCYHACPTGAISKGNYPIFDYKLCIKCYCCMESCPSKAIVLKEKPILRLIKFFRNLRRKPSN